MVEPSSELTVRELERLRTRIERDGLKAVAKELEMDERTVTRLLAKLRTSRGSVALARSGLR